MYCNLMNLRVRMFEITVSKICVDFILWIDSFPYFCKI